jgi:hypothetical protein
MASDLARVGIEGSFAGAVRQAANPDFIGRLHFARYLVESVAADAPRVQRYLGKVGPASWNTSGESRGRGLWIWGQVAMR